MQRSTRRLQGALLVLLACTAIPQASAADYDWCSTVVVRPDQRQQQGDRCLGRWSDEEIANGNAEVVLLGSFTDVSEPRFTHPTGRCGAPEDHAEVGRSVRRLRELRAKSGGPPLWVVHETRFDLVTDTLAALPGFRADFLVRADRPFRAVHGFYETDRSPACQPRGCRWSDSFLGLDGKEAGPRLRDSIDASGGPGRYETAVYYTAPPSQIVRAADRVFSPNAAIADLRNPEYRAWRVAEAKRAVRDGAYGALSLGQKFSMFRDRDHSIASKDARDVAAAAKSDAVWTARPVGYGYPEYAAGWVALGRELRAAGVPYAITDLPAHPWYERWDDPSTPDRDEWKEIREVVLGAKLVLLDRSATGNHAAVEAFAAELRAAGARVVFTDVRCGLAKR